MTLNNTHAVIAEKLADHSKTCKSILESTQMRDLTHADFVINVSKSQALEVGMRDKFTKQTKPKKPKSKSNFYILNSSQVV